MRRLSSRGASVGSCPSPPPFSDTTRAWASDNSLRPSEVCGTVARIEATAARARACVLLAGDELAPALVFSAATVTPSRAGADIGARRQSMGDPSTSIETRQTGSPGFSHFLSLSTVSS